MITVTPDQANAFIFQRQFLNTPAENLLDVVHRLVCVQTQYHASLFGAMWARVAGITAADIDAALLDQRSIVKTWTMRGTLHTVSSDELPLLVAGIMRARLGYFRQWVKKHLAFDDAEIEAFEADIMNALQDGPLDRKAIHAAVETLQNLPSAGWGGDVKGLAYNGDIVFAEGKTFARRDQWCHQLAWQEADPTAARTDILRRYFYAHGPASMVDLRHWLGVYKRTLDAWLADVQLDLVPVSVEGWDGDHFILAEDVEALANTDPTDIPKFNLLPKFDALSLDWADKTRFLDEKHYKQVYRKAAQVEAVFLFNGRVAGVWRQKNNQNTFYTDSVAIP